MSPVLHAAPDTLGAITFAGPMLLALPVAALAGLVSFASPCVLPLVPGYLGYVTGLASTGGGGTRQAGTGVGAGGLEGRGRRRLLAGAVLFVLGFSAVFIAIGFSAGVLGGLLAQWADEIARVLGVLVVVLGLAFVGALPALSGLGRTATVRVRPRPGLAGAPLLGVTFGLGWTPCMGPTLAAITSLAFVSGSGTRSIVLAGAYAAGLGIPFVLVALAAARGVRGLEVLRRHRLALVRAGGALLVVVGVLLVTGVWGQWTSALGARFASWALL
ncbi:cytochrome c biogenesis protein CcdA [uncultured Pseudokineococcus sp.]|uniref:cytochrome c biogenesis CcdA family protein n=1 Tax=uncultured Pseudokineococcus sp. TaxID=1642928 RepID=UPI0026215DB4|nr:cytochrome c biogenesis protein CcdA [uncultured Pseudokineococcus sp.]